MPAPRTASRPVHPRSCKRKHPCLTRNRHVNECLTFCAMHTKAANDRKLPAARRAMHRKAARLHYLEAARHYKTMH